MRALARQQRRGWRQQAHVVRRDVGREVDHAARQTLRRDKREAPRIGFGLREIKQLHARRLQQHLHQLRLRRGDEHQRIDLAGKQRNHGGCRREITQTKRVGLDAVGVQQLGKEVGGAAGLRADVDPQSTQLPETVERGAMRRRARGSGAIKEPHGFVEQAAERFQRHAVLFVDRVERLPGAALDEREIDVLFRVVQQFQVFRRPFGRTQFDLDAVVLQLLRVTLAEFGVRTLFGAGGKHDPLRRRRIEQHVGAPQQQHA